jgi:hypothetical protein
MNSNRLSLEEVSEDEDEGPQSKKDESEKGLVTSKIRVSVLA